MVTAFKNMFKTTKYEHSIIFGMFSSQMCRCLFGRTQQTESYCAKSSLVTLKHRKELTTVHLDFRLKRFLKIITQKKLCGPHINHYKMGQILSSISHH